MPTNNFYGIDKVTSPVKLTPPKYSEVIGSIDTILVKKQRNQQINVDTVNKMSPSYHFSESSVSNTEKFKNYPMMKALWEARHDLNSMFFNFVVL